MHGQYSLALAAESFRIFIDESAPETDHGPILAERFIVGKQSGPR